MPKDEKDPNSPATTSLAYDVMLPRWEKIDRLLGGTEAMRAAGEVVLPRHESESDACWDERRGRAVLFNMTKITLDFWAGRPFSSPVGQEDIPAEMEAILKDVNLSGDNIDVYARRWFHNGLAKAFSHTLVDFPRTSGNPNRTLADDRNEGVRPYFVHIPPENVIFGEPQVVDGREIVNHVRIRESLVVRQGFAETVVNRIKVLDLEPAGSPIFIPAQFGFEANGANTVVDSDGGTLVDFPEARVRVTIYQEDPDAKREEDKWNIVDFYFMDIPEIPLVTFYAEREDFLLAELPANDLADLNIAHFQSESDQTAVLTVARFPILASSGNIDEDKVQIGPRKWLNVSDPQGKWYYVEHEGAAIESGRKDLEAKEEQMSKFGGAFMKKREGGPVSATERSLDSAESTSPLQDVTIRFIDALNNAWRLVGVWQSRNQEEIGKLSVETEFSADDFAQGDLEALLKARVAGDISRSALVAEFVRRGTLDEEFDPDEDAALLEKEREEFADAAAKSDIDPGGGDDPPPDDGPGGGSAGGN